MRCWVLAIVVAHAATASMAVADDDEDPGENPGEDEPLEVVTIGPERPATASGVSRDRAILSASPSRSGSDLMRTVPGVFVTQHGGEGKAHQIFFRGFDAVHGQDLAISVAGAPVNEPSNVHGQGYADLHFVIPEVVERIDALPGAFDPSQGDFAIAGSMRYQLGFDDPGVTATTTLGSFGTRRLFAAYHPADASSETFAAGELYATDGYGVGRSAERASWMGQVVVPLTRRLSGRVMTSVYAGRFDSAGPLPRADVIQGRIDRLGSYDPDQGGRSARTQLLAELRYRSDSFTASVTPYVIRRRLDLRFNFTGFVDDPERGDNTTQRHDFTALGATARFRKDLTILDARDRIGGGVSVRHDFIDQAHQPSHGQGPALVDASVDATDVGTWLELTLHPLSRVKVRGGARFDVLALSVDDRIRAERRAARGYVATPKTSIDVGIVPGLNAVAAYGQGFRSPQARSLEDGERAPFARMNGWELGLRYRDGRAVEASLAGFATLLDDDLLFNETTARNERVPGTFRLGAAANFEARPAPWFISVFGASLTRATLRESQGRLVAGDRLPFVPQVVVRSDNGARPVVARSHGRDVTAIVGLGTSFLHGRALPFGETGTDVLLIDARLGARVGEIELRADVSNLMNRAWNDGEFVYASSFDSTAPTSLVPQRHFTAGAPRTLLFSLTIHP
jgi:TonB dependent receptor-like, beta-barrel/TonB-dependent Receptor Plug Domain